MNATPAAAGPTALNSATLDSAFAATRHTVTGGQRLAKICDIAHPRAELQT